MRPALLLLAATLLATPARAGDDHPLARAAEVLERATPLVEKACGAKFETPPRVALLSTGDAAGAAAQDMRRELDLRYADLPEGKRAGLLRLRAAQSVNSCIARYSASRHEIVLVREAFDAQCAALKVSGERARDLLFVTLCHECVHALDDARFDLAKTYAAPADLDALLAASMVVEGRAVHFGRLAAAEGGAPKDLVDLLPGGEQPSGERAWLPHLTYRLGARFVAALVEKGGAALADKAVAAPPSATWNVCLPSRPADARPDPVALAVLTRAGVAGAGPLSELQLRARYASIVGFDAVEKLFERFTGGGQALVGETNAAVLGFADEEAAKRFEAVSKEDAPTARRGPLVARAIGPEQDDVLAKLVAALDAPRSR